MKMNPEVVEKLRKILTLAADKGAQPGEVEAALAKAKELAIRHSIELSSIDLTPDTDGPATIEVEKNSTLKIRSKYMQPYHRWIFKVLHDVFQVEVIYNKFSDTGGTVITAIHLIGEPVDVAIAIAVFPYLEKVFPATLSRFVSGGTLTYCAADTNGCYYGLCKGIIEANKREEAKLSAQDAGKYALVLRKKEDVIAAKVKEEFPKLKQARKTHKSFSWKGVAKGEQAGTKINLRQVPSSNNSQIK